MCKSPVGMKKHKDYKKAGHPECLKWVEWEQQCRVAWSLRSGSQKQPELEMLEQVLCGECTLWRRPANVGTLAAGCDLSLGLASTPPSWELWSRSSSGVGLSETPGGVAPVQPGATL